jgi:uncharacterized protein (TIGR01777 family)
MRIVLAGASGVIGTALKSALRQDAHEVKVLLRRATSVEGEDSWDPSSAQVDPDFLADADAVICLSGVGVGDHRWTESYKHEIIASRVDSVATIAQSLAAHGGPRLLIAASAVGYYGDRGEELLVESSPAGTGFLAEVCRRWEDASRPAADAGVRVVTLRTGLVLTGSGGLLKRLKPIVKAGIGGRLGSGAQFMPWISLLDEIRAIQFLLSSEIAGPVNLTGPTPERNLAFTKALAENLHRPAMFPTPAFALKAVLGEFGGEALASQRVLPEVLTGAGFEFAHPTLDTALAWALEH